MRIAEERLFEACVYVMMLDLPLTENLILEKMKEARIPSLSISAVRENNIVYSKGFGLRDIASGLSATPHTLYGIGSVTKSFTAIAILQLMEKGKLHLDDPVEKYAPLKLRAFKERVTIHHLLTHTSGIPALAYAEAYISGVLGINENWFPLSTPEEVISFMRGAENRAIAKPGTRFFYLNEGWVLLGYIVSKLSGQSYEEYLRHNILQPLKMDRTFLSRRDVESDADRATAYIIDKEKKHVPSSFPYGITSDGGIISNVNDLSNYLQMFLNQGKFQGKTILLPQTIQLMQKPQALMPYVPYPEGTVFPGEYREKFKRSYGYGMTIQAEPFGYTVIGHGGDVATFNAYIGFVPSLKLGVALLANPSPYLLSNLGRYALAELAGNDPEKLPHIALDRILSRLQGDYQAYKGTLKVTIEKAGDLLIAVFRDRYTEQKVPIVPERLEKDYAEFGVFEDGLKLTAEFTIGERETRLLYERYAFFKKTS